MYNYSTNGVFPFRFVNRSTDKSIFVSQNLEKKKNSLSNLSRGFRTLGISSATRKKIAYATRILSYCSKKRKVRNSQGYYVDHLTTFITLTLPATQRHDDAFITKNVLGSFLDRSRKLGLLHNYVWRAEKQKNGNIHYHLLTDSYASFSLFRNLWYLAVKKFGYLQDYSEKFSNMSFDEYKKLPFNERATPSVIAGRFARGTRNGWSQPPCIDVKAVTSVEGVQAYISKYVSKDSEGSELHVSGRVWACSQSVSASGKELKNSKEFLKFWFEISQSILRKKRIDFDFFSMVKCTIQSIIAWYPELRKVVKTIFSIHFKPCEYWRNSVGMFAT